MEVDVVGQREKLFYLYLNDLRHILYNSNLHNDKAVISLAAQAFGHLVTIAGPLARSIIELEIPRILDWVATQNNKSKNVFFSKLTGGSKKKNASSSQKKNSESQRLAGVWTLKQFATSVPILFSVNLGKRVV